MDDESRPPASEESRPPVADESRPPVADESRAPATDDNRPLAAVSDDDLLRRLREILTRSRRVEGDLVAHIAEVDERRLYAREAFPSMFAYCTEALHLSESEAYLRIAVARASREHPMVLPMLGDGRLHLSGIALLAPHLTRENREALLRRATHRSKREIEELIAEVAPREDVPALIRRLPERGASPAATARTPSGMGRSVTPSPGQLGEALHGSVSVASAPEVGPLDIAPPLPPVVVRPPSVVQPLAPGRYKVQFTASARLHEKLERLRSLMRSQVPDGDLAAIIEAAVSEKLERLEARRFAATSHPRKKLSSADTAAASRHIPAPARRAVRERDGARCAYVDSAGRRCGERERLEYHHLHPFGLGGDHQPENLCLMCHAHNAYLAERDYGRKAMARFSRSTKRIGGVVAVARTTASPGAVAVASSVGTTASPARAAPLGA